MREPIDEASRIEAWRLHELIEAGYPIPQAEKLAARLDIDLHRACDLVHLGHCPPTLAADILL